MKKTVTINISGLVFTIDEDAYDILQNYLNTIKSYFRDSEGRDEIMGDIEARIAEMFQEKIHDKNQVINIEHVEQMISVMGKPEDFVDEETKAESNQNNKGKQTYYTQNKNRRLYRDKDSNVIGGVCSGIGYYFGIDPLWLRLAFVIAFFGYGTGFLFYILLMVIIPEAKTAAEKLEMKGEPVNIDNIGKTIEDELEDLKNRFGKFAHEAQNGTHSAKAKSFFERLFGFFFNLVRALFIFFGKFAGGILLAIGIFILITLLALLIGDGSSIISFTSEGINTFSFNDWSKIVFGSNNEILIASIGLGLLIGIPAITVIYGGVKLLFGTKQKVKGLGIAFTLLWITGLIICAYSSINLGSAFKADDEVVDSVELNITSDTLNLAIGEDIFVISKRKRYNVSKSFLMKIESDQVYLGTPKFTIEKSDDDFFQIDIIKTSNGSTTKEARQLAKDIDYEYNIENNTLIMNPYYSFNLINSFRNQEIGIVLYVPEGKSVYFTNGMERIIYDIDNVSNTFDPYMVEKTWTMLEPGLTCIGCDPDDL